MAILIFWFVWAALGASFALAQGTTVVTSTTGPGSLGTTVTTSGHTIQITGGTRPGNGPNLFHSFEQFSMRSSDTAQFLNTTPSLPTSNILGRVTGGNPSAIFGTIDTMSYPGANLFLMNPAGIVFGPLASLNVGGSVTFTTANYLRLEGTNGANAGIFHTDPTASSLLTSAPVVAFGFLSPNPAAVAVQGSTLTVSPGQLISLVGGNQGVRNTSPDTSDPISIPNGVTVTGGHLQAPDGQIDITSVSSPGEILTGSFDRGPNINGQSFGALGTVQISQQSTIDSSGEGGGTILIQGGRLVVDDSAISANTKAAESGTGPKVSPSGSGIDIQVTQDAVIGNDGIVETNVESGAQHSSGGVRITANEITISGGPKVLAFVATHPPGTDIPFGIRSNVEPGSTAAKSGDVSLNATSSIQIKDRGQIETNASSGSSGDLGNIVVNSSHGNVTLAGLAKVSSFAETTSNGNTGSIKVAAPRGDIILADESHLFNSANGGGTLGEIQIRAHNLRLESFSSIGGDNTSTGTQKPGDTQITLDGRLSLTGGSFISTVAFASLDSADLLIRAPEVFITGKNSDGFSSGLYDNTLGSGNGGRMHLFTDNLQLTDGGILFSKSSIGADNTIPSGRGGDVSVEGYRNPGSSVVINGTESGIFTNAEGIGAAGDISMKASSVRLQNGGTLSAETSGTSLSAKGGAIIINATDQVALTNDASITTSSTGPADAGKIFINAGQQLEVLDGSSITTQAAEASGGNIDIRAIDRIRFVNSTVTTSVLSKDGKGGDIFIDPKVVMLEGSNVTAQAVGGPGGNITFVTPLFLKDPASVVNASSQRGVSGTVTIQSPTSNLSGTVGQLASKTNPPQVLLQNRCIALAGGEQSTFILAGRDALPSEPGGWLSSPVAMEHWTGEETEEQVTRVMVRSRGWNTQPLPVMSKDETTVLSLRRLTPPGFLVRSFADSAATGCSS